MGQQKAVNPQRQGHDVLPDPGYAIHRDLPAVHALVARVGARLVNLGFLDRAVPLAELHRHLPPEAQALNAHYTNAVSRAFYSPEDAIAAAYADLIRQLAREMTDVDFLFQTQPIVRFHFPVPFPDAMRTAKGLPRQFHSDLLGGHPVHMIQAWTALTDCAGTASLHASTREDGRALLDRYRARLGPEDPPFADSLGHFYDTWDTDPGFGEAITAACRPIPLSAGDLLLFDPHCLHGGTENTEDTTRVSLDFRILPLEYEQATLDAASTATAQRFRRGDLFHRQSAGQLHPC